MLKELLKRDENVMYDEDPTPTQAIIGFALGFIGYMYVFPYLLMFLFVQIFHLNNTTPQSTLEIYSLVAQLVSGALVLIVMFIMNRKQMKNAFKNFNSKTFTLGLKYFLISYVLTVIYNILFSLLGGDLGSNANQSSLDTLMKNAPFLAVLLTCIVAPLIEEMIFRYYLYKGIEKHNPILAIFVTAFLFAGIHLFASIGSGTFLEDLKTFPAYLIPSFVMTFAYYKHRKLGVSLVCHITNNVFATLMFFLQPIIMGPGSDSVSQVIIRLFC